MIFLFEMQINSTMKKIRLLLLFLLWIIGNVLMNIIRSEILGNINIIRIKHFIHWFISKSTIETFYNEKKTKTNEFLRFILFVDCCCCWWCWWW